MRGGGPFFPYIPRYITLSNWLPQFLICVFGEALRNVLFFWFLSAGGSKSSDTLTVQQQQIQSHKKMISMDGIYVCPASQKQGSISVLQDLTLHHPQHKQFGLAWLEATEGALLPLFHRPSVSTRSTHTSALYILLAVFFLVIYIGGVGWPPPTIVGPILPDGNPSSSLCRCTDGRKYPSLSGWMPRLFFLFIGRGHTHTAAAAGACLRRKDLFLADVLRE